MENRYRNGKIYKIVDNGFNKMYIGSTTQELSQRFTDHRRMYKNFIQGQYHFVSIYSLFDEFGVENCKILLLEDFPCNSKAELDRKEGQYILSNPCVNRIVAGRTSKEYYEHNADRIKVEHRERYNINKDKHKEYRQEYRRQNRDKLNENNRKYKEQHKDETKAYAKIYNKTYRESHREQFREYHRRYHEGKKERLAEQNQAVKQTTDQRCFIYCISDIIYKRYPDELDVYLYKNI